MSDRSSSTASQEAPEGTFATVGEELRQRADSVWTRGGAPAIGKLNRLTLKGKRGRVAIVDACRTPFVRAAGVFAKMDVVDLASVATSELIRRSELDPAEVDFAVFGVVIPALYAPNLGREVVLRTSLPKAIPGYTVNLACASSNRALTSAAEAILLGQADVVLAGGAESLSTVPITYSRNASQRFIAAGRAKGLTKKAAILSQIRPGDLVPDPPAIAEHHTGQTMGESCEKMAKENGISRRAQDEIALLSHQRAASATDEGRLAGQVVATFPQPGFTGPVVEDDGIRRDTSLAALEKLRPTFDRGYGTLTAGNSSPLTDGAAAVLLMSEERAKALGHEPLGFIRSYAYAALDPGTQLLQGPAYAAPQALDRAGVKLSDLDLVDMHEAFAAQVLSNLKALASKKFARDELGRSQPVGEVDLARFNVNGGSISIGHPFGATGARVTMQLLAELRRRGLGLGMLTVCAAGGNAVAMVVER